MKTTLYISTLALSVCLGTGCSSSRKTERAAAVGAATGAVVGGVIGNQSGNPRTGAAVGAAAGAVAGAAYGSQQDRQIASNDSSDYYMSLMTPDEVDTLRARARSSGSSQSALTDYLTPQEKVNLRRRDAARREIGR